MRMMTLAAGVAALAIAAPATAQKPDRGGEGGGKPAKVERGGGGGGQARAERRADRVERRGNEFRGRQTERREARVDRVRDRRDDRADRVRDRREARVERVRDQREERFDRVRGNDRSRDIREVRVRNDRQDDRRAVRIVRDDDRRDGYGLRYAGNDRARGLIDGCPPGLAAKNNGCLPPGQAKKLIGRALPAAFATSLLPSAYRAYYPDNDDYYYREGDGLLYRIARSSGLVDGYSPLWGYGVDYVPDYYHVGERYPLDYVSFYNVPVQYQDWYRDEDDWLYRYGDGGIYRVNRSNGLVDAIVALVAGDLAVGQPLPVAYDVYNVPYAYRDRYYDTDDNWYRYSDGYIYQVDPKTRLIQAVIQALV